MLSPLEYDNLKRRGFLRQRQEGFFVVRTRMRCGNYSSAHLQALLDISKKFAQGFVHATTRQGLEIPFVRYEDIDAVESALRQAGIETGTSGPRLRTTTCCPGTNWCKSGLVDTFALYDKIEQELNLRCAMDLPHKFKIVISGCPNTCTRAQHSEIGIHGALDARNPTVPGYTLYLGGCGGRAPRAGIKLKKVYTQEELLPIIAAVVAFYKAHATARQRLALLIEETGVERFFSELGLE